MDFLRKRQEQEITELCARQKQETAQASESADALFSVKNREEMQHVLQAQADKVDHMASAVEDERKNDIVLPARPKNVDEIVVPTRKRARQQDVLQSTVTADEQHHSNLAARVQSLQAEVLRQKAIMSEQEVQRINAVKILKGLQCPDGYFRQAYDIRTKDLSEDDFLGTAVAIFEGTMASLTTLTHSHKTISTAMRGAGTVGFPPYGPL
ncbi:hypothetical protein K491DRAFT_675824 [Lophiostoma macrostomum CBS 122681]|uniref:Uncharacterized protein n=1 Tax=Lophiostoma macrostomum CBS 122681 TaxID=1314788 RepID=A0A6A6THB4_9PLEO|nr:hypothetical protein K491DRAFT_675824 [Lophiostoma macrostomum CBS 122681]